MQVRFNLVYKTYVVIPSVFNPYKDVIVFVLQGIPTYDILIYKNKMERNQKNDNKIIPFIQRLYNKKNDE